MLLLLLLELIKIPTCIHSLPLEKRRFAIISRSVSCKFMKTSSQLEIIMQVSNFLSETECVCYKIPECPVLSGGGPRVVVSTAAFHARVRGSVPGLGGLKETKLFLPHPRVKVSIVGSLRDREVACSASDRQGLNFESCVWRTVSSQSSHHPQEVLLAQFSLYVHKGALKPDSFHFICPVLSYIVGGWVLKSNAICVPTLGHCEF